jgi:hypothetical protein
VIGSASAWIDGHSHRGAVFDVKAGQCRQQRRDQHERDKVHRAEELVGRAVPAHDGVSSQETKR